MPSPAALHRALRLAAALALAACLGPAVATAQTDDGSVTVDIDKAIEDAAAAAKAFEEEQKNNPAYQHRKKGDALLKEKKYDAAIREFDAALKLSPGDQTTYVQKGIALTAKGRPDLAIPLYDKAMAMNVRSKVWLWWPLKHKGDALAQAGQIDKSVAAYTKAIALNPTAELFARRAKSYVQMGALEKSLADSRRASEESPNWSLPWSMQSFAYAMIARRDKNAEAGAKACQAAAKACELGDCRPAKQFKPVCNP